MTKLLNRWSHQQETALLQMVKRKRAGQRIAGFSKSERADAKLLLLAFAPVVPLAVSDQLGFSRGVIWWGWLVLGIGWCAFVMGICFAAYWRAIRQSVRRKP
jgi:hypothetical protein